MSWATRAAPGLTTANSVPKQLQFQKPLCSGKLGEQTSKVKHPRENQSPVSLGNTKGPGFSPLFAYNDPLQSCDLCYLHNALLSYPLFQFSLIISTSQVPEGRMKISIQQRRLLKPRRGREFVSRICGRTKTGILNSQVLLDFHFLVYQGKSSPFCGIQCSHHL